MGWRKEEREGGIEGEEEGRWDRGWKRGKVGKEGGRLGKEGGKKGRMERREGRRKRGTSGDAVEMKQDATCLFFPVFFFNLIFFLSSFLNFFLVALHFLEGRAGDAQVQAEGNAPVFVIAADCVVVFVVMFMLFFCCFMLLLFFFMLLLFSLLFLLLFLCCFLLFFLLFYVAFCFFILILLFFLLLLLLFFVVVYLRAHVGMTLVVPVDYVMLSLNSIIQGVDKWLREIRACLCLCVFMCVSL